MCPGCPPLFYFLGLSFGWPLSAPSYTHSHTQSMHFRQGANGKINYQPAKALARQFWLERERAHRRGWLEWREVVQELREGERKTRKEDTLVTKKKVEKREKCLGKWDRMYKGKGGWWERKIGWRISWSSFVVCEVPGHHFSCHFTISGHHRGLKWPITHTCKHSIHLRTISGIGYSLRSSSLDIKPTDLPRTSEMVCAVCIYLYFWSQVLLCKRRKNTHTSRSRKINCCLLVLFSLFLKV